MTVWNSQNWGLLSLVLCIEIPVCGLSARCVLLEVLEAECWCRYTRDSLRGVRVFTRRWCAAVVFCATCPRIAAGHTLLQSIVLRFCGLLSRVQGAAGVMAAWRGAALPPASVAICLMEGVPATSKFGALAPKREL